MICSELSDLPEHLRMFNFVLGCVRVGDIIKLNSTFLNQALIMHAWKYELLTEPISSLQPQVPPKHPVIVSSFQGVILHCIGVVGVTSPFYQPPSTCSRSGRTIGSPYKSVGILITPDNTMSCLVKAEELWNFGLGECSRLCSGVLVKQSAWDRLRIPHDSTFKAYRPMTIAILPMCPEQPT